jgi:hypothetical protein
MPVRTLGIGEVSHPAVLVVLPPFSPKIEAPSSQFRLIMLCQPAMTVVSFSSSPGCSGVVLSYVASFASSLIGNIR